MAADRRDKLEAVVGDLADEASALDSLLARLGDEAFTNPTPADGWDIRDSVAHLAIGDDLAVECITSDRVPELMQRGIDAVLEGEAATLAFEREMLAPGRAMSPCEVLDWWRRSNAALREALGEVRPDRRLPWGPQTMGAVSFATARLMETWAHGLDCFDAAEVQPVDTGRLRHIADLSLRALPYAFMIKGFASPGPVRLELTSPSGDRWSFGRDDAPTVIRGSASDWCRVAVHRDRRDERGRLVGEGPDAADVMTNAQAYL